MIGVVVPAHDEAELLPACLAGLRRAAARVDERVVVVVAADTCSDPTAALARAAGAHVVTLRARCVGAARRAAAARALALGADWLASTDADTVVDAAWLRTQRALGADAVCGTVTVDDWSPHDEAVRRAFAATYRAVEGHAHVHGANLGVSAAAYTGVGGWAALPVGEDVALVTALQAAGRRVVWSTAPCVVTSARRDVRAAGGFGDHLLGLARPA